MKRCSSSLLFVSGFVAGSLALAYGCGGTEDDSTFGNGKNGNGDLFGGNGDGGGGNNTGEFQDAAGLLEAGCAQATARAARQPVYMLIVLDGSGSMDKQHKWEAAVPALDAFFDGLKGDTTIGVGLTVFSDQEDKTGGKGPYPNVDVPIKVVDATQATALRDRIDNTSPQGTTPTFPALEGQYPQLEAFTPADPLAAGGKRVLVFMTDGVPNPNPDVQQPQSIALAKAETAKGILLFSVGIGDLNSLKDYDPRFMGDLAVAGGTAPTGCDTNELQDETKMCHFQITPGNKSAQQLEQEFRTAIDKIRGAVASCEFTLDKTGSGGQNVDPSKVNVVYDDGVGGSGVIPQDDANGWTYDNPTDPGKVILHGSSCDQLK